MPSKIRSEDTLIFYGFDPKITNTKDVLKELSRFFEMKQQNDQSDRFNFIAFNNMRPVYFENFLFDWHAIVDEIKNHSKNFVLPNLAGGLYTACTFMIDVFKIVGGKIFRVIILTDKSTPSFKNVEVVKQLLDSIKDFPVFVDFITLNSKNPAEEKIYYDFARRYGGGVINIKKEKELGGAFDILAQKKRLAKDSTGNEVLKINTELEPFFNNLAQDPIEVTEKGTQPIKCLICRKEGDELIKCPKCGTPFHGSCLAQWAKISQIGIIHVFRCVQCFNLLRLPKAFVIDVQCGSYFERMKKIQQVQTTPDYEANIAHHYNELRINEKKSKPQLIQADDPLAVFDDFYADAK